MSVFPSTLDVGDLIDQLNYRYFRVAALALAWSRDGRYIALGTQGNYPSDTVTVNAHLLIVDVETRTIIKDYESNSGTISGISWSPDNRTIAVYSADDTLKLWNVETGNVLATFSGSGPSKYWIGQPDFSRYSGRLAYGITFDPAQQNFARSGDLADLGIQIVVPDASVERLRSIAGLCGAPIAIADVLTADTLDADGARAFIARVESLPEGVIPPACAADLLAVAGAIAAR